MSDHLLSLITPTRWSLFEGFLKHTEAANISTANTRLVSSRKSTKTAAPFQSTPPVLQVSPPVPSFHIRSERRPTLYPFLGKCHIDQPTHSSSQPSSTAHDREISFAPHGICRPSRYRNQPRDDRRGIGSSRDPACKNRCLRRCRKS